MPPTDAPAASTFGRKLRLIVLITIAVQIVRWVVTAHPATEAAMAGPAATIPTPPARSPRVAPRIAPSAAPVAPVVQAAASPIGIDRNWIMTEGGIGPVSFGMAVDSAKRYFGPSFIAPPDTSGRGCDRAFGPMLPIGLHLKVDNDRIVAADVDMPEFETSQHVRKGMTEAQVRAAYPPPRNTIAREGDANGYQLVVTPRADLPTNQFHFVFYKDTLREISVGNWALMPHWKHC